MEFYSNNSCWKNIKSWQCYLVYNLLLFFFSDIFSHNFRAVRNLYQLVLRQQKAEQDEETDEVEDPIKRVRQQLDKVKEFLYLYFYSFFYLRFTYLFMILHQLQMKWDVLNKLKQKSLNYKIFIFVLFPYKSK